MPDPCLEEKRLAFGRVAEQYDEARPSYPPAAIDELIELAGVGPGARVVEIGAGTGKATRLLAERGLSVLALEPDAAMAALARRACSDFPLVDIEQAAFEDWQPCERVALLVCAQAWHWLKPAIRYVRASEALTSGGLLAALWTLPVWEGSILRDALRQAYADTVPELAPDFPMHPASSWEDMTGVWRADVDASGCFLTPALSSHRWSLDYSALEYARLLGTHQDHILLPDDRRAALMAAVADVIEAGGGTIAMRYETCLCTARAR